MFGHFTERARKVMALANQEAQRFNHEHIGTEHILLGFIKEGSGIGATVLKNLDVDIKKLRIEVERRVKSGPDMVTLGKLPQTPRAKKVIEYAIEEARSLNCNYVGTEHILIGLFRETDGTAAQVFTNLGLILEVVRQELLNLPGIRLEKKISRQKPTSNMKVNAYRQRMKDFLSTKLTRAEKLFLVLYYYEELTIEEIAEVLDLTESRVSQMHSSIISRNKSFMHGKE